MLAASEPPSREKGWFIAVVFLVGGAINVWGARRQWHRKPNFFDQPRPPFMAFGDATWHGMGRTYPLLTAWTLLFPVPIGLAFAVAEPGEGAFFWGFFAFSAAVFVILLPFTISVHFFNTPKWMVPPHRRAEPGALREWRETRRHRREARPRKEPQQPGDTT